MSEAISSQNKLGQASEGEEDDMAHGDLGNGLVRKPSYIYELEAFSSLTSRPRRGSTRKSFGLVMLPHKGEEYETAVFRCSGCNSLNDMSVKKSGINGFSSCSRQNSSGKTLVLFLLKNGCYYLKTKQKLEVINPQEPVFLAMLVP